jgi:hypothetical protein
MADLMVCPVCGVYMDGNHDDVAGEHDRAAQAGALADLALSLLREVHPVAHPRCRPGPVEGCPDPRFIRDLAKINAARPGAPNG